MPAARSSPIPAAATVPDHARPLAVGECPGLLERLAMLPDPRDRRGRRHILASVLAVSAAAVLAGARSVTATAEGAADGPGAVLAPLGARRRRGGPWPRWGCAVTRSPAAARSPARPPSAGCWHGSTAIGSTGRSARGWPPGRARRAPHARAGAPARA